MPYMLAWTAILILWGLWSLLVWMTHGFSAWALKHAGAWMEAVPSIDQLGLPEWLQPWIPAEWLQALLHLVQAIGPMLDSLVQSWPAFFGSGMTVLAWVAWSLGSFALALLGGITHLLILAWRRHATAPHPSAIGSNAHVG